MPEIPSIPNKSYFTINIQNHRIFAAPWKWSRFFSVLNGSLSLYIYSLFTLSSLHNCTYLGNYSVACDFNECNCYVLLFFHLLCTLFRSILFRLFNTINLKHFLAFSFRYECEILCKCNNFQVFFFCYHLYRRFLHSYRHHCWRRCRFGCKCWKWHHHHQMDHNLNSNKLRAISKSDKHN